MSVWASLEELRAFAYDTRHVDVLRRRREWFERHAEAHLVLWWVPVGHRPTTAEAIERLEHLRAHGPTVEAFTFRVPFGPPDSALTSDGPGPPAVGAEFCWPEAGVA